MNLFIFAQRFFIFFILISLSNCQSFQKMVKGSDSATGPQQAIEARKAFDKKTYKEIKLENELRILLVSDPQAKQCAASMNVNVGSLSNPKEMQGLA
ncbi:MAG: insulinase family protein, partial [Oligoflexales bacterium]|nr:insulinase family protein [Oligoflexales bacterium]